jgi:hypothetical protein
MTISIIISEFLKKISGIRDVFLLDEADRFELLKIEVAAEKKAFMGMGKMYNSGIRGVLQCPIVFVAITDMNLDWGFQSHMLLMKDDEIVGEEVYDPGKIAELQKKLNVSFLHRNFVIYKDKIDFPRDIVEKKCYFELPACVGDGTFPGVNHFGESMYCFPSTPGDVFLKQRYYESIDERGTGTLVIGFKWSH